MKPTVKKDQSVQPQRPSIAKLEALMVKHGALVRPTGQDLPEFPTNHTFTPGLYVRTIFMVAGSLVVSRIHKTEHPFIVSKGHCLVYSDNDGPVSIKAPYMGITKPGTHRVLLILEDTLWSTFHPTDLTDVEEIENKILEPLESHQGLLKDGGSK